MQIDNKRPGKGKLRTQGAEQKKLNKSSFLRAEKNVKGTFFFYLKKG